MTLARQVSKKEREARSWAPVVKASCHRWPVLLCKQKTRSQGHKVAGEVHTIRKATPQTITTLAGTL